MVTRRRIVVLSLVVVAALPTDPGTARARHRAANDGTHVLVAFKRGTSRSAREDAHGSQRASLVRRLTQLKVDVVRVRSGDRVDEVAARYRRNRRVAWAEPNHIRRATVIPNDPGFPQQYGLSKIRAPEAWDLVPSLTGSPFPTGNYTIGFVDTGVDMNHPDLAGRVITPCFQATSGPGTLAPGCADDQGHGTSAAGVATALTNNGQGIAGVANGRIYMCRALDFTGAGTDADIASCVSEIASKRNQHDIRVLNMSLGGPFDSPVLRAAIDQAVSAGILVVAAAGNEGSTEVEFPAGYPNVLSVGATDQNDAHAPFSNFNADVEISAPGVSILTTDLGGGYGFISGTSFAAPFVAGAAGLVSFATGRTGSSLASALTGSADDLGAAGRDPFFGFGRLNLCRALGGSCGGAPPVSPPPVVTPAPGDQDGSISGTVVRVRRGRVRTLRRAEICVSGAAGRGCTTTGRGGFYGFIVPPGGYEVSASRRRLTCAAGSPTGEFSPVSVAVSPGEDVVLDWFCS